MYSKVSTLILIFFSSFLYFYALAGIPSGFYADEVTIGYNAYSLLKTGRDEYGQFLPTALRLYGSYTPPLYAYITMLPISFFGLSVFSTRFMSAISGVISALLVYLFLKHTASLNSKKILKQTASSQAGIRDHDNLMPFFGALFFAISPWVVFYTRLGYEVYFAFMLFFLGIFFLYKGLSNNFYIALATIPLSFSTYASHSTKFLAPILFITYLMIFRKHVHVRLLFQSSRSIFLILFSFILQVPNIVLLSTGAFFVKNDLFYWDVIQTRADAINLPYLLSIPYSFCFEFFGRYFSYFSPYSLFTLGDPDSQRSLPSLSVFYTWMVIPYLVGLYSVIKTPQLKNKFLLFLLLILPIAGALTKDPFSTQRALPFFLPVFLTIWTGIEMITKKITPFVKKSVLLSFFALSILFLYRSYFVLFPTENATSWGYGYNELFEKLQLYKDQHIVIDNSRTKPLTAYYLFTNNYEPQKSHELQYMENYYTPKTYFDKNIENIEFRPITWEKDIYKTEVLVGDNLTFSKNHIIEHKLEKVFEITTPDNELVFAGYKTNPKEKCKNNQNPLCFTNE